MAVLLLVLLCVSSYAQHAKSTPADFRGPMFFDTFHEAWNIQSRWTIYNVHDPSIIKTTTGFVMYSTDVAMGMASPVGLHKRVSNDLINWTFEGTAFAGAPQEAIDHIRIQDPNFVPTSLWAPDIINVGTEYRMYYSLSYFGTTNSWMGLATSQSATGPWVQRGRVLTTSRTHDRNAIDPSIIIDPVTNRHWMAYGSYWTGIYIVELNPATGFILTPGDRGVNIVRRAAAALEGAELFFNNGWYYIFVSYGWLEDTYNIRVGRSRNPQGPYLDFHGNNMVHATDNFPLIKRPYRFLDHVGWQGTGHCTVFRDGERVFIANQGRPSSSIHNMVLHLREVFWIDGWPVVSPQRFANVPDWPIHRDSIVGRWEHMPLHAAGVHALPEIMSFDANGAINGSTANTWSLSGDTLILSWQGGLFRDRLLLHWGWDWENRHVTLLYTGMNQHGLNLWGKKINQRARNALTVLEHGSSYRLRNHHSNMLMGVGANVVGEGVRIRDEGGTDVQEWVLIDAGNGFFQLSPYNSGGLVLEVANQNPNNGAALRIGTNVNGHHQMWRIRYLNNGYFTLLSRISGERRCAEVAGFAVHNGASVVQWDTLRGNNQMWRFERLKTGLPVGTAEIPEENQVFTVFPNPSIDGAFNVDLRNIDPSYNLTLSIYELKGRLLKRKTGKGGSLHTLNQFAEKGIYLLVVESDDGAFIGKQRIVIN